METVKMMIELPKETYNMIKNFSNWKNSQVVIEDIEKAITQLPSVTSQEPFKPMVEIDLDYVIKQKYIEREILDKIRAEIKGMTPTYHNPDWSITDLVPISEVLDVVDKYKAEVEPQESEE